MGPYVGLWVGRVPNVQLAEGQEGDLSRQVHLVELHEDLGAHLVSLHNMVKESGSRMEKKSATKIILSIVDIKIFSI